MAIKKMFNIMRAIMCRKRILISALSICIGCIRSQEQILESAKEYAEESDFQAMVKELEKGVKTKYPLAMVCLADELMSGKNIEPNHERAFSLYHEAAELGESNSMWNVSLCYKAGIGTKPNVSRSRHWAMKAARAGILPAIYDYVGSLKPDNPEYLDLLAIAAKQDMTGFAEYKISEVYAKRMDHENVFQELENWLQASAYKGYDQAKKDLARVYFEGSCGFPEDWEKSLEYLDQCEHGDFEYLMMGLACLNEKTSVFNPIRGVDYLEKAYRGSLDRYHEENIAVILGFAYLLGADFLPGLHCNQDRAMYFLENASYNSSAAMVLGVIYALGIGNSEVDRNKANNYFRKALRDDEYALDARRWRDAISNLGWLERDKAFIKIRPTPFTTRRENPYLPNFHDCINKLVNAYYDQIEADALHEKQAAEEERERKRIAVEERRQLVEREKQRIAREKEEWERTHPEEVAARKRTAEEKERKEREEKIQLTKERMQKIQDVIKQYNIIIGEDVPPVSLETLSTLRLFVNRYDGWNRLFSYSINGRSYALSSAGPDGESGTSDDISIVHDVGSVTTNTTMTGSSDEFEKWKAKREKPRTQKNVAEVIEVVPSGKPIETNGEGKPISTTD